MKHRIGRVEQEILRETTDILRKRVRDPRTESVSFTAVEVTNDLSQAAIFYSLLSDKASDDEKAAAGLEKAKGLIRHELGQRLTVYKVPELIFKRDTSVQYGAKIDQLINKLKKEEK